MIVPGLVSATFKGLPVDEVIQIALNAGLKAIEWSENHHIPMGDLEFAQDVARKCRENGLAIAGYGSYYRLGQGMEIKPSLDTAKALGATSMRIWAGSKPSAEVSEEERKVLLDELHKASVLAGCYNIVLNLEWHKNTLTDENESGLDVLKKIGSPWLRTLWQPTQALSFEQRLEGLKMIGSYLSYLHVYYWDETGRRPFGEGIRHWSSYFEALDEKKDYYALLEFVKDNTVEQFNDDAEVLKSLLRKGE